MVFFSDRLKWFGNMPLDFSYEIDLVHFFAPIGHNIIKLILSIIANLIFIFLNNVSIESIFII